MQRSVLMHARALIASVSSFLSFVRRDSFSSFWSWVIVGHPRVGKHRGQGPSWVPPWICTSHLCPDHVSRIYLYAVFYYIISQIEHLVFLQLYGPSLHIAKLCLIEQDLRPNNLSCPAHMATHLLGFAEQHQRYASQH